MAENVGAIQFEMIIDDKSLASEISRVGASFNKSFKNMFSGISSQMNNFTKNTVGQMTGSVNNFSNTATSSNNKVSSSVEKLNSQYSKTQEEIKKVEAELSALESKQLDVFNRFKDMPKLSGDSTQAESVDKMMGQDAGYQKLMAESDSLYEKLDALEEKNRGLAEQIRKVGNESESTGQKMSGMGKKSSNSSKEVKKVTQETRKLSTELSTGGKKTVHFGSMLNSTFKSILRRLFIYNLIMKGIKGIASAMSSALNTNSQYANSLNLIKTNLKVAFQPIYDFILPAINALMKGLGTATTYIASAISAMFGKTYEQSYAAAKKLDSAKKSMDGYGSAVKKAGKDAKGATASFDTLNTLDLSKDEDIGGGGGLDGSDFAPIPELTDPGFSKLSGLAKEFYDNWGSKDIVDGIKEGLELVNFSAIQDNFQETLEGWGGIAETAFKSTQPVFKAGGELLGTRLKYGIAIAGNVLEPMTKGLANFTTNMKGPIKDWIKETSSTVTDGINNMTSVTETVGQSWLGSVLKYKPKIEKETEKTFTNMANHAMLNGTVMADSFNIVTAGIKKFVDENEIEINLFTDSILQMFTDMWGLVNNVWEDSLNILGAFWDEWGKGIVEGVMEVLSDIGEWFLYLWNDLVKPVWDEMLSWVQEMWDDTFKGIFEVLLETVGKVWDLIKVLWDKIFKPLVDLIIIFFVPAFKNGFSTILGVIKAAVKGIGAVIKGLLKALGGVIDFIVGVFTGDWSRAWEGIKDIFGGIFESLVGLVKAPINAIIAIINGMVGGVVGGINSVISAINKMGFTIPDWIPGVGGKDFSLNIPEIAGPPKIPMLAKGGIVDQPTLAMVGEQGKEAVVPLENNTEWIDKLAMAIAGAIGQSNQKGHNDRSNDSDGDVVFKIGEREFGRISIKAINNANRQAGKNLLLV